MNNIQRLLATEGSDALNKINKIFKSLIAGRYKIDESMGEVIVTVKKGEPVPLDRDVMRKLSNVTNGDFQMYVDAIKGQVVLTFNVE